MIYTLLKLDMNRRLWVLFVIVTQILDVQLIYLNGFHRDRQSTRGMLIQCIYIVFIIMTYKRRIDCYIQCVP